MSHLSHHARPAGTCRIDLHCHSSASSEAGEALLGAINCPESFSEPDEIYATASRRGMDFVTITDHDSIAGVETLLTGKNVLVGEELTCWFPEDRCKMHVLVWGHTAEQHDALQGCAHDLYEVAAYLERHRIAHSVAHPVYRQNDVLELWHLERLLLLFKGFECLNGAHSLLHREAFEPLVTTLGPEEIGRLSRRHRIKPLWPMPWHKARTGGSDDHGLLNIGRTWTEFPAGTDSAAKILDCIREGRCQPGGEAGSSLKLAHNFYSVGIRYHGQRMVRKHNAATRMLQAMMGQRPLRTSDLVRAAVKDSMRTLGRRLRAPLRTRTPEPSGTLLLSKLFRRSIGQRIRASPELLGALRDGRAAFGEHEAMFQLLCDVSRDTTAGTIESVVQGIAKGKLGPAFDALSSLGLQQFMLMPYYFSLFHQNRERPLLARVTGRVRPLSRESLKLGVFTDTFDEVNGVSRFLQMLGKEATLRNRSLTIHTCVTPARVGGPYRKNFAPLASCPMPAYPQLTLSLPPVLEVMEWADRQQFDAIHVHTPGPMGLCGLLVASMLRVPVLGTYHTDFPAYVLDHTGDHRLTVFAHSLMSWFYARATSVFARSRAYEQTLARMGIAAERLKVLPACVDTELFTPRHRHRNFWHDRMIPGQHHLLYCGRVSAEKNLGILVETFKRICAARQDAALVIAGDGPQLDDMKAQLKGLPAYFMGRLGDAELAPLYANSDLLLFPSKTDTLGQVVLEGQASGLPVLVSDQGGPRETMDEGLTGLVLPGDDAAAWASAVIELLADEPRRLRMSRTAPLRVARCSTSRTFEAYWDEHVASAQAAARRHAAAAAPPPAPVYADEPEPARATEAAAS